MYIFLAQEKLRKVVNKCKTDKTTIDELNKKITRAEQDIEMANDKCNQTREAQKLAEVKVMELEQRFATAQKELKEAQDDKGERFTELVFQFDQIMNHLQSCVAQLAPA